MKYAAGSEMMGTYRREIADIRQKMRAAQAEIEPQEVDDYEFKTPAGTVRLSELFGEHEDLMVVHNMGRPVRAAHCGPMATTACITM